MARYCTLVLMVYTIVAGFARHLSGWAEDISQLAFDIILIYDGFMVLRILVILLMLWPGWYSPPAVARGLPAARPRLAPGDTSAHYLPLVQYFPGAPNPASIEVVKTAQGEIEGYPTVYYLYGYVRNLTTEPFYAVAVAIQVTICPYGDPPPDCYTDIVQVTPALTATLPVQPNPFSYRMYLGKASGSINGIVGVSASPWMWDSYDYPVNVLEYSYNQEAKIIGTARNDSGYPLHTARIVGFEAQHCGWREAELETTDLAPGQVITFTITTFSASCGVDDRLIVSGQGAFQGWVLP